MRHFFLLYLGICLFAASRALGSEQAISLQYANDTCQGEVDFLLATITPPESCASLITDTSCTKTGFKSELGMCTTKDAKEFLAAQDKKEFIHGVQYPDSKCSSEPELQMYLRKDACISFNETVYIKANCQEFLSCTDSACTNCVERPSLSGVFDSCVTGEDLAGKGLRFENCPSSGDVSSHTVPFMGTVFGTIAFTFTML